MEPQLTHCAHCSKPMSSALHECPHCKKMVPIMMECRICRESTPSAEAVEEFGVPIQTKYQRAYHPHCLDEVMRKFSCPLCKVVISRGNIRAVCFSDDKKCANCGNSLSITTCHWCGAYLIVQYAERSGTWVHDYDSLTAYCHPVCRPRFIANRLEKKECLECGWPLTSWDQFRNRQIHKACKN